MLSGELTLLADPLHGPWVFSILEPPIRVGNGNSVEFIDNRGSLGFGVRAWHVATLGGWGGRRCVALSHDQR